VAVCERLTAAGSVALPIIFDDTSVIATLVTAGAEPATETLRPHGLRPLMWRRRALAMVVVFDYRRTSIGPYREATLSFCVMRHGRVGFWVDKLPVTTDLACAAGQEIWGYPKWVTSIDWRRDGSTIRAAVGNELVVEVGNSRAPAVPLPLSFTTFTELDGRLVRTRVRARGRAQLVPGSRARVRVLGPGPLADRVESLGLTRDPMLALRIENFHSELPEGRFAVRA
jgi:hypothetical protein